MTDTATTLSKGAQIMHRELMRECGHLVTVGQLLELGVHNPKTRADELRAAGITLTTVDVKDGGLVGWVL